MKFQIPRYKGFKVGIFRISPIYNTNIDLVNDDVHTKFGLILSIRSQDIE